MMAEMKVAYLASVRAELRVAMLVALLVNEMVVKLAILKAMMKVEIDNTKVAWKGQWLVAH